MTRYAYRDNDYVETSSPVRGRDPETGEMALYHGDGAVAYFTDAETSSVALGGIVKPAGEIGESGKYGFAMAAAEINLIFDETPDGAVVYRVFEAPGDFRVVDPVTYRETRPSD